MKIRLAVVFACYCGGDYSCKSALNLETLICVTFTTKKENN